VAAGAGVVVGVGVAAAPGAAPMAGPTAAAGPPPVARNAGMVEPRAVPTDESDAAVLRPPTVC